MKSRPADLNETFCTKIIEEVSNKVKRCFVEEDENPDDNVFLIWSNLKMHEECPDRPDISGMVLANSQFSNIVCVGEVKGEDRINDSHAILCDLIRIGCFSKDAIDTYSNKGVLGIHVVGFQVTMYVTTLLSEGLYVMQEVISIRLPASIYAMKSFIANLEDTLSVKEIYNQCMKKNENTAQYKKKALDIEACSNI